MISAVGEDFRDGREVQGDDDVERGAIGRFVEPLEFDWPVHYDRAVATAYGYSDILAPYSSIMTWTIPPLWYPGTHIFTSAERNAQPAHNPLSGVRTNLAPPTTGFFATDIEIDYLKPVVAGDPLSPVGWTLISCAAQETSVGRGALMTLESEVRNQRGDVFARARTGPYSYNPHASQSD